MKKLFKGGLIVYPDKSVKEDILVDGEKIVSVRGNIEDDEAEWIDVSDKLLFPGFIDTHTHFHLEVSDTVTADNFETASKAAIAEGTTFNIDFATQNRGETLAQALSSWDKKASGKSSCDYSYHMAISDWNSDVSKEIDQMVESGITSFKLYMTYDAMFLNDADFYKVLKRVKEAGGLVEVHCENKGLIDALVEEEKAKGNTGPYYHHITRPYQAEAEAVFRLLKIAEVVDTPVLVVHLSTAEGFEVISQARAKGQRVYAETCPQYLVLTDERYSLPGFEGAKYVIAPPLRTENDQKVLWEAVINGEINTIATDHCSFTWEQKQMGRDDFTKIPCGMPGVENRPSLLYTYGVKQGRITKEQMCELLSENPARLYGLYPDKGTLLPGSDADIVVWNPQAERTLTAKKQLSAADYHPYEGITVSGQAEQVYLRGQLVARDGQVVKEKTGRYVRRKRPEFI